MGRDFGKPFPLKAMHLNGHSRAFGQFVEGGKDQAQFVARDGIDFCVRLLVCDGLYRFSFQINGLGSQPAQTAPAVDRQVADDAIKVSHWFLDQCFPFGLIQA